MTNSPFNGVTSASRVKIFQKVDLLLGRRHCWMLIYVICFTALAILPCLHGYVLVSDRGGFVIIEESL